MDLRISSVDDAGRRVLTLAGSVDLGSRSLLTDAVSTAVAEAGVEQVVLDLSGVEFIDSTGLGAIVESSGKAEDTGRGFALRNPSKRVGRILELTGLDDQWPIERSADGESLSS